MSIGWQFGSLLGNMLFRPDGPTIRGPRLNDLQVMASTYNAMIPIGWGKWRQAGNLIAMPKKGIKEVKKKQSVGGGGLFGKGGGGTSQTIVSYSYFATVEVAWCEAEADLLAIWGDVKLIYDRRPGAKQIKKYKKMEVRHRTGSETQLPDSIWEAEFGVGEVPAGRGVSSTVLVDLPLEDFGNRIPELHGLMARVTTGTHFLERVENGVGGLSGYAHVLLVDRERYTAYALLIQDGGINRVGKFDLLENKFILQTYNGPDHLRAWDITTDGLVVAQHGLFVALLDPQTLQIIAENTTDPIGGSFSGSTGGVGCRQLKVDRVSGQGNIWSAHTATLHCGDDIVRVYSATLALLAEINTVGLGYGEVKDVESIDSDGNAWAMTTLAQLVKMTPSGQVTAYDLSGLFTPSFIVPHAFYDEASNSVLIIAGDTIHKWSVDSQSIVGQLTINGAIWPRGLDTVNGKQWIPVGAAFGQSYFAEVNIVTLQVERTYLWTSIPNAQGPGFGYLASVYMPDSHSLVADWQKGLTGFGFDHIYLDRATTDSVPLWKIQADLCRHAGLIADRDVQLGNKDIDVSELNDLVPGFAVGRQSSAAAWSQPLLTGYFYDAYCGDGKIRFPKRGKAPMLKIPQKYLAAHELGAEMPEPLAKTKGQATEAPKKTHVSYWNLEKDYEQDTESFNRELTASKGEITAELPIATTKDHAAKIAEVLMHEYHTHLDTRELALSIMYFHLDPTDVIEVEVEEIV